MQQITRINIKCEKNSSQLTGMIRGGASNSHTCHPSSEGVLRIGSLPQAIKPQQALKRISAALSLIPLLVAVQQHLHQCRSLSGLSAW